MSPFRKSTEQDTIIDLTESESTPEGSGSSKLVWGLPLPCPKCEQPGYLDRIDARGQVMHQHCPSCFCSWETDRADLESFVSAS